MQIGTTRISAEQRNLLGEVAYYTRGGAPPGSSVPHLARALYRLSRLPDEEELDPQWLEVYKSAKPMLKSVVPEEIAEQITSFFDQVSTFDSALWGLNPKRLRATFLLGAGASKPSPSDIPTVRELLPHLLDRARRLDRDDVSKLADFCEKRHIDNIEDLLTAAKLATFCSRNPVVLSLVNYLLYRREDEETESKPGADLSSVAFLQDTLQTLFGLLSSTMLPAKPNAAHKAIAQYVKAQPGASIVTTNYDCCMDLALGNMGKDFVYNLDFANIKPSPPTKACARLIKLHGSLNWYYCETCQKIQLIDIGQMVDSFQNDRAPYPVIGICKECGGQRRGLLVPPLAMKFDLAPPLTPLVSCASDAFGSADLIIVVGFSFAEADLYIWV